MRVFSALLALAAANGCAKQGMVRKPDTVAISDSLGFPKPDRPVSSIVAARWSDESDRDRYNEAPNVIRLAGIRAGMTVADIGAGDGYYVTRVSPVVSSAGRVLAEDIMPDYLDLLRVRVQKERLANVEIIHGSAEDPHLPDRSVDVALMIHMYHEITSPFALLWHLSAAMKSGGVVAILDQDAPTDRHGTPPRLLQCELEKLGFTFRKREVLSDGAYVALFAPPPTQLPAAEIRHRLTENRCVQ